MRPSDLLAATMGGRFDDVYCRTSPLTGATMSTLVWPKTCREPSRRRARRCCFGCASERRDMRRDLHILRGQTQVFDRPESSKDRTNFDPGAVFIGRRMVDLLGNAIPDGPIELIEITVQLHERGVPLCRSVASSRLAGLRIAGRPRGGHECP